MLFTGIDALGYALLADISYVLLDGTPVSTDVARVASYDRWESVTLDVTYRARGWTPRHIAALEKSNSLGRAGRIDDRSRRLPAREEFVAAAAHATAERELYDTIVKRIEALGLKRNRYAGTCVVTGVDVAEGGGFIRKVGSKWQTISFRAAREMIDAK